MKTVVLYKTMTGCTQRYAEIISQNTGADCFRLGKISPKKVASYDTVVFGGCVHGGVISGLKKFKSIAKKCGNAKLAVFAVGAATETDKMVQDLISGNFPEGTGSIKFFFLKGGFNLAKLKQPFRGFMGWIRKMVESNPQKKPDEIEFLKMFEAGDDGVNEKNAEALVKYVKGL